MKIHKEKGALSLLASELGIENRTQLFSYVRALAYGRSHTRDDFSLVLHESKGTCSSKHALVKSISEEQGWDEISLVLMIYKMNQDNTPRIGDVLEGSAIAYIPEAHCILKIAGVEHDITTESSDFESFRDSILLEVVIDPWQVGDWKVDFHKDYLSNWIKEGELAVDLKEIWALREECIQRITENGN